MARGPRLVSLAGRYLTGTLLLLAYTWLTGELWQGLRLCAAQPRVLGLILMMQPPLWLGVNILLRITRDCGATITTSVTAVRKMVSFGLSFVFLSRAEKPFTPMHAVGLAIAVVCSAGLQAQAEGNARRRPEEKKES